MLREKLDVAILEDFVGGLARTAGFRVAAFDSHGVLITTSPPVGEFGLLCDGSLSALPRPVDLRPMPADEPPASLAFLEYHGAWHIIAPVHVNERVAGYVAIGEFREPRGSAPALPAGGVHVEPDQWLRAWDALPVLERRSEGRGVVVARWAARMLGEWSRREDQLSSTAEQFSLLGDIGELISGERHLQTVLDRMVAETARVMRCQHASLRLYDANTDELRIAAVFNLSKQYIAGGIVSRKRNAVDDEALHGEIVYIEDAQTDSRIQFPEQARRLGIVSGLVVGMMHRGKPVGVLRIYSNHRRRFRTSQRQVLRAVASQAAIAIVNARLVEERLRSVELERQLRLAGDVQARMVRTRPPPHPQIEAALVFDPSSHVGGDFCDLFSLPDGRLAAAVGDVVGHGVAAALLMASVRGAMRACAEQSNDLAEIMRRLNQHACRETGPGEFVTLLLVAVAPDARSFTLCNAGHETPLRLRSGEIVSSETAGLVLGLDPNEPYEEASLDLAPADFVLLYTDGVIEAMNFEEQLFTRERLRGSLSLHGVMSPEPALRNIHWDIRRFVGLAEQTDDLTMIGLRVKPG